MLQKSITLVIFTIIIFIFSCDIKTEDEQYQDIMKLDNSEERVIELTKFLIKYPDNKNIDKIYRRMYRDYIALKDEKNAIIYADKYLEFFPKGYRMSQLNGVAWTLAENKMGLDSAKVYADRAVAQASESGLRTLNIRYFFKRRFI